MRKITIADLPSGLVSAVRSAEDGLVEAQNELSDAAMKLIDVRKGNVVRNPETGVKYVIETVSFHFSYGRPNIYVNGYRISQSALPSLKGYKEARAVTHGLSMSCEVIAADISEWLKETADAKTAK